MLKPHYNKKHITKEEYKDILRKAVPKVRTLDTNYLMIITLNHFLIRFVTTKPVKSIFKKSTR